jgi:hypothetical protein
MEIMENHYSRCIDCAGVCGFLGAAGSNPALLSREV